MDVQQTISLISMLQGLMGPKVAPSDPMQMMMQFVTLQKAMQGDAPLPKNESGETDMVGAMVELGKSYAPIVKEMIDAKRGAQAPVAPMTITANGHHQLQHSAPIVLQPPTPNGVDEMNSIKLIVPVIMLAARSNQPVQAYSDIVLNTANDEQLQEYVQNPDWYEKLVALEPAIANHRQWFEQLRADILEVLTNPEPDDIQGKDKDQTTG